MRRTTSDDDVVTAGFRQWLRIVLFAGLVVVPFWFWESARAVMRHEAPATATMSAQDAQGIWWIMGLTLVVWLPLWGWFAWILSSLLAGTRRRTSR